MALKKVQNISDNVKVSLNFDGEELAEGAHVQDTELTDLDIVDVYMN